MNSTNAPAPQWLRECQPILDGLRAAGWNEDDVANRTSVNERRNPRHEHEGLLLTCYLVRAEGFICTCCVSTAEPAGELPEDGYRIHFWKMGEMVKSSRASKGREAGQRMAAMLNTSQHRERTDTGPNGTWTLGRGQSVHRWSGGPAWRDPVDLSASQAATAPHTPSA